MRLNRIVFFSTFVGLPLEFTKIFQYKLNYMSLIFYQFYF